MSRRQWRRAVAVNASFLPLKKVRIVGAARVNDHRVLSESNLPTIRTNGSIRVYPESDAGFSLLLMDFGEIPKVR
jgi:hypothetical protein